jgi:hypothetical protein
MRSTHTSDRVSTYIILQSREQDRKADRRNYTARTEDTVNEEKNKRQHFVGLYSLLIPTDPNYRSQLIKLHVNTRVTNHSHM